MEKAREAAEQYAVRFNDVESQLISGEQLLSNEVRDRRMALPERREAEISSTIGVGSELRIKYPTYIGPADQNQVSVEIRIKEPAALDVPDTLTVLWQSTENDRQSELLTLERAADDPPGIVETLRSRG